MKAKLHAANYKQKVKAWHDRKVKHRSYDVGNWVLRKHEATGSKAPIGKLSPNWEGPNVISKVVKEGTR